MQVTRAGEYGVLGLLCLARRGTGQVVMIDEVSREGRIPKSFLAKIFQNLARAGLVHSNRGTGGGFALSREPSQITVLQIIEAIEGRIAFQRCLQGGTDCRHVGGCPLCGLFERAQTEVRDVFARTTLAGLMESRSPVTAVPRRKTTGNQNGNTTLSGPSQERKKSSRYERQLHPV
jgi:Rrf2 family transcriptional regulator, iron-sulfur cluster assembly transcription factor